MKARDFIIIALIMLNVALVAVLVVQHQQAPQKTTVANILGTPAMAGAAVTEAGYFKATTIRLAGNREGVAIIDTMTNRLLFYQRPAGRNEWDRPPTIINLARDFGHPGAR